MHTSLQMMPEQAGLSSQSMAGYIHNLNYLEAQHRTLLTALHRTMLPHMIPVMTRTRIRTRASKTPGTSSSTRYVFLVGATMRTCSTRMSAEFLCVFSLYSLMLIFLFQRSVKARTLFFTSSRLCSLPGIVIYIQAIPNIQYH